MEGGGGREGEEGGDRGAGGPNPCRGNERFLIDYL